MLVPVKPPRRYDYDSATRSSDSDQPPPREMYSRIVRERSPERSQTEKSLRSPEMAIYNEPDNIPRRPRQNSSDDDSPSGPRFRAVDVKRYETTESLNRPPPLRATENVPVTYARTRIAANDYSNRRYHSAGAEIDMGPNEQPLRKFITREPSVERVQPGDRQSKRSYKLQMSSSQPGGTLVQERSRMFSNPPLRRDYAVRR